MLAALLVQAPPSQQSQRPVGPLDSLRSSIGTRVSQVKGAVVAVAILDLQTGDSLFVNADESFHAASTMKVPVMIELFRQIDAGRWRLDQKVPLANQFESIVDGSTYSLNAADDSDSSAYGLVGQNVAIRDLLDRMITRSSNLATNALIGLVDAKKANASYNRGSSCPVATPASATSEACVPR